LLRTGGRRTLHCGKQANHATIHRRIYTRPFLRGVPIPDRWGAYKSDSAANVRFPPKADISTKGCPTAPYLCSKLPDERIRLPEIPTEESAATAGRPGASFSSSTPSLAPEASPGPLHWWG
jgi:hypothetical protein